MKDLFLIFVLLIGAAVALFVGLVVLQPGPPSAPAPTPTPTPSLPETRGSPAPEERPSAEEAPPLPLKIEGFAFVSFERTDPAFPGEEYSVTVFFAPEEGSPYEGIVESLGITRFQLQNPEAGPEILATLLLLGEQTEEITLDDVPMTFFVNEPAGLAGLAWQEGLQIYYVLVSGVLGGEGEGEESNRDRLKEAARVAAKAVLAQEQTHPMQGPPGG